MNDLQFWLLVAVMLVFLGENFILIILFRQDMGKLEEKLSKLFQGIIRLATLMESFSGKKSVTSKVKSSDTQVMVSVQEIERLRDVEAAWNKKEMVEIQERLRQRVGVIKADETEKNREDDAIEYGEKGFQ